MSCVPILSDASDLSLQGCYGATYALLCRGKVPARNYLILSTEDSVAMHTCLLKAAAETHAQPCRNSMQALNIRMHANVEDG